MLSQWQVYTALGIAFLILTPLYAIYLRKRLFFPAWANLSGDSSLDVGTSLAELFYSELQSIRRIHEQAANDVSIWNDKSNVPTLEQSSDGYPWFIREAELIASGTPLLRLVKFLPLLGRPSQVKASIHRFDDTMYLQLRLEGPVVRRLAPGANHVFTRQHPAQELKTLPEAVKLLAYEVFMDLTGITEFSRPEGFRQFTQAYTSTPFTSGSRPRSWQRRHWSDMPLVPVTRSEARP